MKNAAWHVCECAKSDLESMMFTHSRRDRKAFIFFSAVVIFFEKCVAHLTLFLSYYCVPNKLIGLDSSVVEYFWWYGVCLVCRNVLLKILNMDDVGGRSVLYDDIVRIRGFPDDGLIDDKRRTKFSSPKMLVIKIKIQND